MMGESGRGSRRVVAGLKITSATLAKARISMGNPLELSGFAKGGSPLWRTRKTNSRVVSPRATATVCSFFKVSLGGYPRFSPIRGTCQEGLKPRGDGSDRIVSLSPCSYLPYIFRGGAEGLWLLLVWTTILFLCGNFCGASRLGFMRDFWLSAYTCGATPNSGNVRERQKKEEEKEEKTPQHSKCCVGLHNNSFVWIEIELFKQNFCISDTKG